MRRFWMAACLLTALAASTPAAAQDTMTPVQKAYVTYLQTKGYAPTIDGDGDVVFKATLGSRNVTLFVGASDPDTQFFRLVLANIWPIESEAERQKVLNACNVANKKLKVAKVYATDNNVWIAVELFLASPGQYQPVFDRSMSVISQAIDTFVEAMR